MKSLQEIKDQIAWLDAMADRAVLGRSGVPVEDGPIYRAQAYALKWAISENSGYLFGPR